MAPDGSYIAQLEAEFSCDARDSLALFEVVVENLRSDDAPAAEGVNLLRLEAKKLLVLTTRLNRPLIDLLLHRLEDYLLDLEDPTASQVDDIGAFIDVMRGRLDGEIDGELNEAEFVRSLPVRRPADIGDIEFRNVEVLVVERSRASARIVERELAKRGCRVTTARRSFEALELSVRTKPDMVISAVVLDEMSGVDLALALAAIPATEKIPFALITSFDSEDAVMDRVPDNTVVMRKIPDFYTDLADALERFGIA